MDPIEPSLSSFDLYNCFKPAQKAHVVARFSGKYSTVDYHSTYQRVPHILHRYLIIKSKNES